MSIEAQDEYVDPSPFLHVDTSDITTLFEDANCTTPANPTSGSIVRGVTSKGRNNNIRLSITTNQMQLLYRPNGLSYVRLQTAYGVWSPSTLPSGLKLNSSGGTLIWVGAVENDAAGWTAFPWNLCKSGPAEHMSALINANINGTNYTYMGFGCALGAQDNRMRISSSFSPNKAGILVATASPYTGNCTLRTRVSGQGSFSVPSGTAIKPFDPTFFPSVGFIQCSRAATGNTGITGAIFELRVYDRVLPTDELNTLLNSLWSKWGI